MPAATLASVAKDDTAQRPAHLIARGAAQTAAGASRRFAPPARHCRQKGFAISDSTSARLSPMSFSM